MIYGKIHRTRFCIFLPKKCLATTLPVKKLSKKMACAIVCVVHAAVAIVTKDSQVEFVQMVSTGGTN